MLQRSGLRVQPDEPAAGSGDRQRDPDRIQERRRPRSGRHHHLVGVDASVIRHHAHHSVPVLDHGSRRQVVPDHRAALHGHQCQRHGQCGRRQAVAVMHQPSAEDVPRELRLESEDGARFQRLHVDPRGDVGSVRALAEAHLRLVERDGEQSDRRLVQPERDGAALGDLEVAREAGSRHREQGRIGRGEPESVVAARRAGGELLSFEERHRSAAARQLEGARRADDPTAHDHDVRHVGRERNAGPLESAAETWLSGRKQPPAKRLGG